MLPSNFDFAMFPAGTSKKTLKELGMLASTLESIDYAMASWVKEDLQLSARTNEGFIPVPVLWQTPERAFQIKNEESLRDDGGALKLPILSIERTSIAKDPERKGGFQAQIYSSDKNGRTGRMVIAKKIKQDKTRNYAVADGRRSYIDDSGAVQRWVPRFNKKIVIQTLSIPIPIYININYKIVIKTEYQEQMNQLVAPFIARTGQINSFVMRRNGHLYEAFIEQDFTQSNNVASLDEDMRMFSTEINIRVLGYLIGEGDNDDRPIVRYHENAVEITFPQESTVSPSAGGTSTGDTDSWFGELETLSDTNQNSSGQTKVTEIQTIWPADADGNATAINVARGVDEEGNVIYNAEYLGDPDWENSAILPTNPIYNSAWWFVETNED
tara:strand:+ start:2786 stop:3940 length:1155 start_codon:yes stop_codon:yes gene_type:complete